ncbi:putative protoheme IX farnesyltransferase [Wallemia mellicola]|nr:putative protoheme IX farnesyltransferase [Wallemia mellicola]TIC19654.1 putative protoheme IX farnesyltransferase [Wallemia mellicola]TIC75681.1 putative protoheme IX farnesyltransferase [Wallemia mellicola]
MFINPTKHFFTSYRANQFYLHPLSNSPSAVSLNIPNNRRIAWKKLPRLSIQQRFKLYKQLSKSRLTFLVVLTSMAGYALCPDSPAIGYKEELTTLLSTAGGVALCSASANALNQMLEVPLDSQMARTRVRPLCTRLMSPIHAVVFAGVTGLAGVGLLATGVNAPSAALGAANIALYSGIYTPLKRVHIINTWVGSIVGAIPPLIGWTASSGRLIPDSLDWKDIGAISALPYVLYTWQFPHFNSLAHLLRPQYASSGYSMLSVSNPLKNSIVALRHAFIMLPLTAVLFPWSGLTTWNFAFTSTAINAPFAYLSWAFYREIKKNNPGDVAARRLFHASLIHLPLTLVLAMYHKRNSNHIDNYMNNSITTIDN